MPDVKVRAIIMRVRKCFFIVYLPKVKCRYSDPKRVAKSYVSFVFANNSLMALSVKRGNGDFAVAAVIN
jgi:agmatine/peptidylarginine deiminase